MTEPERRVLGLTPGGRVSASTTMPELRRTDRPGPDRVLARPRRQPALDLAGDLPGAAEAGPRAHLDDHLRQQPPRRRTARQAPERAPQRRARAGAPGNRARRDLTPHARRRSRGRGGSRSRRSPAPTTARSPTRSGWWSRSCSSRASCPAWSRPRSLELGIDMGARRPRDPGRVAEVGLPGPAAGRPRRPPARARSPRAGSSPSSAPTCSSARWSPSGCATGEIEETVIPRNPLDVLAQHLVSMVADDEWEVDEIERVVTATEPFSELSREQLENVLDMLDGRYPSEKFAELRPRLVWDRTAGTVRGRKGARQLAVTNAGTIPDRGLYGVHLPDGRRVGELDEEMVYEARPGPDLPARGDHLADPGHHPRPGDRRPRARGSRRGAVLARRRRRPPVRARPRDRRLLPRGGLQGRRDAGRRVRPRRARGREPARLPARAAGRDPGRALRRDDRGREVPRRDRRLAPVRALAVRRPRARRLGAGALAPGSATSSTSRRTRSGPTTASSSTSPTPTSRPTPTWSCSSPTRSRTWSSRELGGSALFGARFRENAARSLLLPRAYPGKRTPLWQQRLKSQNLLEVAKDFPRFPVILETYRECLRDVLDLPALIELLRDLHSRKITLVEVETQTRLAVRLLAALRLRRHLHVRGRHAERRAPRGGPRPRPRPALRAARRRRAARADRPRGARGGRALAAAAAPRRARQGPRRAPAGAAPARRPDRRASSSSAPPRASRPSRCSASSSASAARSPVRIAGEERWIAAEDAGLYRDALGVPPPGGLPESFLEPVAGRDGRRSSAATRAPTARSRPAQISAPLRPRPDPGAAGSSSAPGELVRGELLPGGSEREWCDSDVLRRRAPRQRRRPAPGGRGGRPGRARALPAGVAERRRPPPGGRRPRPPARGAGAAAGGRADARRSGSATCSRAGSAPTARPGSTS